MSLVLMKNIYKRFGTVVSLRGVNFDVRSNEVVGLIGDNGAGKSTLIKILCGVFPPSEGDIYIQGQRVNTRTFSVRKAYDFGIEPVYQEQALGLKQTLWRNIFVGRQLTNRFGFIKRKEEKQAAEEIMRSFLGFRSKGISSDSKVQVLSGGERQGVAIGRAMYFNAKLIVLDEPTNALSVKEVNKVLTFICKAKQEGKSCVYISHNVANIYSVSDRFVILDRGEVMATYNKDDISEDELMRVLNTHKSAVV